MIYIYIYSYILCNKAVAMCSRATSSGGLFWSSPNEIHVTCVWHDSFIRLTRLSSMCVMTYSHVCYMTYFYVGYDSSRVRHLSGVPRSPIKLRAKWQLLAKRGCVFVFLWDSSNWVYIHTLCKYVCIYTCIHICIYICIYTYRFIYLYVCIYIHINIYVHTCIYVYVYMYRYIYTYMYIFTHIYIYTYICIILYDYIYAWFMYVFMNFLMLQRNSHVLENTHACRFFSWEFVFFSVRKRCSWDLTIYIDMNFHSYVGMYRNYICKYEFYLCIVRKNLTEKKSDSYIHMYTIICLSVFILESLFMHIKLISFIHRMDIYIYMCVFLCTRTFVFCCTHIERILKSVDILESLPYISNRYALYRE